MEKLIFIALIYCIPNFDKEMYSSRSVPLSYFLFMGFSIEKKVIWKWYLLKTEKMSLANEIELKSKKKSNLKYMFFK